MSLKLAYKAGPPICQNSSKMLWRSSSLTDMAEQSIWLGVVDLPVDDPLHHGSPGRSRTDGVHIDVVRRQPESTHLGEADHFRLGFVVRWVLWITLAPGNRRDVDDLAVPARLHELRHGVCYLGDTLYVEHVDLVPVDLVRVIGTVLPARRNEDRGVVDQDIDPAERLDRVADERLDGVDPSDVDLVRAEDRFGVLRLKFGHGVSDVSEVQLGDDDRSAVVGHFRGDTAGMPDHDRGSGTPHQRFSGALADGSIVPNSRWL